MSKRDKHIRPRGLPAGQESGWGQGAMSSPQPHHIPLDGTHWKVLTSQRGCQTEGVGAGPQSTQAGLNFIQTWMLEFQKS